jgi:hypothetical protein
MKYTDEQIKAFAEAHIEKLMNNEYLVETDLDIFPCNLTYEDFSEAIRKTSPNSRLFRATFER